MIDFWASALRGAAISVAIRGETKRFALPPTFPCAWQTGAVDRERWELLQAITAGMNGPPTQAQLALLDHLAPPVSGRIVH